MKSEPVAIIGAVMAIVVALITFGVLEWTDAQVDAFEKMLIAVVPLLIVAAGTLAERAIVFSPQTVAEKYVQVAHGDEAIADDGAGDDA